MSQSSSHKYRKKYRKKPVEIEAHRVPVESVRHLASSYAWELAKWCGGDLRDDGAILILTLEGEMRADPGDWIIQGVKGEFYPYKPDIFEATYEPV